MKLTTAYMNSAKTLPDMFEAIQRASVPQKFTHNFLESLGFKSTYDRAFINVLKGLGFLDSNSAPTQIYSRFRDKSAGKKVLGQQIKKAYDDLFMADEKANQLSSEDVKGKLATITGKDEAVAAKMAATFKQLASLADFSGTPAPVAEEPEVEEKVESPAALQVQKPLAPGFSFSHVINIVLPTTKDVAVYDAIFRSLREHLL